MSSTSPNLQYFTSESVSMGHPDKVSDQISDAILDSLLKHDPYARCAVETLVTTGLAVVAGEVTVHTHEAKEALGSVEETVRHTIRDIGYDDPALGFDYRSCAVVRTIHSQSPDISQGVTKGAGRHQEMGAGDQGLMFGFACDETDVLMPLPIHLAHRLVEKMATLRQSGEIPWIKPDAKSQVTIAYEGSKPVGINTVVVSTQHDESVTDKATGFLTTEAERIIREQVIKAVVDQHAPGMWSNDIIFHINPTGRFVIGGPHGDTGLTGRKIIVDTYGGRGRHGGGAFSGKDATKVDRSACYMARHVAKNIVAAGLAKQCEVQLAYAIGVAEPVSIWVDTYGTGVKTRKSLEAVVKEVFPLTPSGIIEYLRLHQPIFKQTAAHGHFGRVGESFTWESTHRVNDLRQVAGIA